MVYGTNFNFGGRTENGCAPKWNHIAIRNIYTGNAMAQVTVCPLLAHLGVPPTALPLSVKIKV
jgi:hypothetical protein